jgi:nondiscriminating glutamyl-tRNA synthetase
LPALFKASRLCFCFGIIATIQDSLETLSDVTEQAGIFFQPVSLSAEASQIAEEGKSVIACFEKKLADVKKADRETFKILLNQVKEETGKKGKNLFMPVRIALTGQTHGPDLAAIFEIIGKAESLNRLTKQISKTCPAITILPRLLASFACSLLSHMRCLTWG